MTAVSQNSVIRRCRFNVRFARRRTWLKGAPHLILCLGLPPGQRTRPCIGQQFGQIVSPKYRFRVRTQPRLWAAARDVLRAVFLLQARWRNSCTRHKKCARVLDGRYQFCRIVGAVKAKPLGGVKASCQITSPGSIGAVNPTRRLSSNSSKSRSCIASMYSSR